MKISYSLWWPAILLSLFNTGQLFTTGQVDANWMHNHQLTLLLKGPKMGSYPSKPWLYLVSNTQSTSIMHIPDKTDQQLKPLVDYLNPPLTCIQPRDNQVERQSDQHMMAWLHIGKQPPVTTTQTENEDTVFHSSKCTIMTRVSIVNVIGILQHFILEMSSTKHRQLCWTQVCVDTDRQVTNTSSV